MKYRKKPVVIEAIRYDGDNWIEVLDFIGYNTIGETKAMWIKEGKIAIPTLEGTMTGNVGDFIIKGVMEECYPCKPDIFEQTYEKVDE